MERLLYVVLGFLAVLAIVAYVSFFSVAGKFSRWLDAHPATQPVSQPLIVVVPPLPSKATVLHPAILPDPWYVRIRKELTK